MAAPFRYAPALLEADARLLYRRAASIHSTAVVVGLVLGAIVGATPLTDLVTAWKIPAEYGVATAIVGAALGTLLGFAVGQGRARQLRAQAQRTLCALTTERTVDSILRLLDSAAMEPHAAMARTAPTTSTHEAAVIDRLTELSSAQA